MERLLEEEGDRLLRMCALYLKDPALAEDAVQDAFVRAMQAWPRFRGECSERTFLVRIAVNVCKNYLKSPWHRRRAPAQALEAVPAQAEELPDDNLPRAVMALPRKYRETVILYYYQELKACEIAALLGVSVSTVTVRLSRARGMLKQQLKGWYYDEEG